MSALDNVKVAKVVRVRPGDVIWLCIARPIGREAVDALRDSAKNLWPDNEVVVAADVDVKVVRAT